MLWITNLAGERLTPTREERIIILGEIRGNKLLNVYTSAEVAEMLGITEEQLHDELRYISDVLKDIVCHWKP